MKTEQNSSPRFRGAPVDVVVDVRTKLEYWMGHLPGAVHIPVEQITEGMAGRADVLLTSRILVYCAGGSRSATAAAHLRAAGFRNVVDGGGMADARADFVP